jgi:hypothetical protein
MIEIYKQIRFKAWKLKTMFSQAKDVHD